MDNERIQRLIEIQNALIEFICDPDNPLDDVEQAELKQKVAWSCSDQAIAAWINRSSSIRALIAPIVEYLVNHPGARQQLKDAFGHDFSFHEHKDDETFSFAFRQLDENLKSLLKSLMVFMYENLGGSGYSKSLMQDSIAFKRGDFILLWEEQNSSLNVCPACDGKAPDLIGGKRESDVDHFLPKSKYPLLALHPHNLVPICIECNQRIKSDIDPIEYKGVASLTNGFLPYNTADTISLIDVTCERDDAGAMYVMITAKDNAHAIRAISLNLVFALEERWSGRIDEVKKEVIDGLREATYGFQRIIQYEEIDSEQYVKEILESTIKYAEFGSRPNRVIYQSYIRFSLADDVEVSELDAIFNM